MRYIWRHVPLIFTALFLVAGILSSFIISMSVNERYLGELETVSGTIERVEMTDPSVTIFLEGSRQDYWIIPAAVNMVTRERIKSDLVVGTIVDMKVHHFRDRLSVCGIIVDDTVILSVDEMAERAYSDSMIALWFGIILVSLTFAASLIFFVIWVRREIKRKKMDSSELNEYGERKILYEYLGNTIAVYHEPFTLTIFLNNELHSQHNSFVAATQKMNFLIKAYNEETNEYTEKILTLTINGFGTLRLYHNKDLLIKKMQPFG